MARINAGAVGVLFIIASTAAAQAQQTVITSKSPYWKVGVEDPALSRACAIGRFGLKDPKRYVARFTGPEGGAVLGIAKGSGLNLVDPDHKAKPNEDYFFHDHGTSSCAVYVGGRNK
ncbi:MAG TPA: hypothetical protein VFA12_09835 [Stellaceae bacterium]|nr:hypothetical protein [Stellaceae bacterium]